MLTPPLCEGLTCFPHAFQVCVDIMQEYMNSLLWMEVFRHNRELYWVFNHQMDITIFFHLPTLAWWHLTLLTYNTLHTQLLDVYMGLLQLWVLASTIDTHHSLSWHQLPWNLLIFGQVSLPPFGLLSTIFCL